MTPAIRIKDFPGHIRFEINEGLREKIFSQAMEKAGQIEIEKHWIKSWPHPEGDIQIQCTPAFYRGCKAEIIELLNAGPMKTSEVQKGLKNYHITHVYRSIKSLKNAGAITVEKGLLALNTDPSEQVEIRDFRKIIDLSNPGLRRRYGISKKEVELAVYLIYGYEKTGEGKIGDEGFFKKTFRGACLLAAAVKHWKKGGADIPKWALICLTDLTGSGGYLESEGAVQSYHSPSGNRIIPWHKGKYLLPVKADLDLDCLVIKIILKSWGNGAYYNFRDSDVFFEDLHRLFGSFKNAQIPSAIREIIKCYYEIECFDRSAAKIPVKIKRKWKAASTAEEINFKAGVVNTIFEMASRYNGHYELTSRSVEFLEDLSQIFIDLNIGELNIRKRAGRPHYRCWVSSKKIEGLHYIKSPGEIYPDFKVWSAIPMNQLHTKIAIKLGEKEQWIAVEESCREELVNFIGLILDGFLCKSNELEITNYFWNAKRVPSRHSVKQFLRVRDSNAVSEPAVEWVA